MKLLLLASLLVLVNASFVEFLQGLQHHSSFQRLPEEEKLLFGQLVVAAEDDELTEFIDRTGLIHVLKLMDRESLALSLWIIQTMNHESRMCILPCVDIGNLNYGHEQNKQSLIITSVGLVH